MKPKAIKRKLGRRQKAFKDQVSEATRRGIPASAFRMPGSLNARKR